MTQKPLFPTDIFVRNSLGRKSIKITTAGEKLKCCTSCGEWRPIKLFKVRSDRPGNKRVAHCNQCRGRIERERYPDRIKRQKERAKQRAITPKHKASVMLKGCQKRAAEKGLPCTINKEWIRLRLEIGHCEVTGIPFVMKRKTSEHHIVASPWSPSVDRIEPQKGYTPENARVVVAAFNFAKSSHSDKTLLQLAEAIDRNKHRLKI
jgi:hypothetical protein